MTSTGTTTFNPAASSLTLTAFGRIGFKPPQVLTEHLATAHAEGNLLQVELGNHQPNLWKSEVYDITLVADDATYDLPTRMIAIQDIYLTTTDASDTSVDRLLFPLTLFEYDSLPNKELVAPPTCYLIEKTREPQITFWAVPDDTQDYVAHVRLLSRIEDMSQRNGLTLDLPYTYLDVYIAGLAYRLARHFKPEMEQIREANYEKALAAAQKTDTQDSTSIFIRPDFSGYHR